jgi:hypothetical protein
MTGVGCAELGSSDSLVLSPEMSFLANFTINDFTASFRPGCENLILAKDLLMISKKFIGAF